MRGHGALLLILALGLTACSPSDDGAPSDAVNEPVESGVEIEYLAHASFLLHGDDGTEVLIDPFASRVWLGYDWPEGIDPDAILITHPHYDHDAGRYREMPFPWSEALPIFDAPGQATFGSIRVTGVEGKHADPYGMEFGQLNTLMLMEVGGLRIAHLGDNGPLTPAMVDGLGRVDVLMLPADGVYHIISEETTQEILAALSPRIVIPMHYRLGDLEVEADAPSDLGDIDPWLEGRVGVERVGSHRLRITPDDLTGEPGGAPRILVFEHAPYVIAPG